MDCYTSSIHTAILPNVECCDTARDDSLFSTFARAIMIARLEPHNVSKTVLPPTHALAFPILHLTRYGDLHLNPEGI